MNKFISFIIICCINITVIAQTDYVAYHGSLKVKGTKIVNKYNDTVCFSGPSLFWSNTYWGGEKFYNSDVVSWVNLDWDAPIIRASMGVDDSWGYLQDAANKTRVKTVVQAAIDNGMYVIIDWHSHHAENYLSQAMTFFTEMAQTYGSYPNVIYEIYNEPLNVSWTNVIKPYAQSVISAIRNEDPDNIIVVGTPNWSQDVDVASSSPITGFSNIAYSLHFYAGTHGADLRQKAQTAINNGICLVVTEWGTVNANGNGDVAQSSVDEWVEFMKDNKLTNCNWSLNDKSEGASALVNGAYPYGEWDASDLTASGTVVYDLIKYWDGNYVSIPKININEIATIYKTSKGSIIIQSKNVTEKFAITLFDIEGNALQKYNCNSNYEIQAQNLAKGIYVLQIESENGKQSFKFIR